MKHGGPGRSTVPVLAFGGLPVFFGYFHFIDGAGRKCQVDFRKKRKQSEGGVVYAVDSQCFVGFIFFEKN
jgi:hypothetical protein